MRPATPCVTCPTARASSQRTTRASSAPTGAWSAGQSPGAPGRPATRSTCAVLPSVGIVTICCSVLARRACIVALQCPAPVQCAAQFTPPGRGAGGLFCLCPLCPACSCRKSLHCLFMLSTCAWRSPFVAETVESSDAYLVAGPIFNDYSSTGYTMLLRKQKMIDVSLSPACCPFPCSACAPGCNGPWSATCAFSLERFIHPLVNQDAMKPSCSAAKYAVRQASLPDCFPFSTLGSL